MGLAVIGAIDWLIPCAGELLAVIPALLAGLVMGPGLALAAAAYALAILCRVAENTIMPAEVEGKLTHALSEENLRSAARSLRHAKRIDVPRVDYEKLASDRVGEASEAVRQRVLSARE